MLEGRWGVREVRRCGEESPFWKGDVWKQEEQVQ